MLKRLLLATALLAPVSFAHADTITVGYSDLSTDGGVITTIGQSAGTPVQFTYTFLGSGFGFGQIIALLIPQGPGQAPAFEFAFNDGFVPPQGGTIRLYATWQGANVPGNPVTFPSLFQTNEMPTGTNGLSVSMQIFTCNNGHVYCDDYLSPGGKTVGSSTVVDQLSTDFPTFTKTVPTHPFAITEVFTFSQDRASFPDSPQGDVGAAIITQPIGHVNPVPGPIAGAGLPGLLALLGLLGWRWRRRVA